MKKHKLSITRPWLWALVTPAAFFTATAVAGGLTYPIVDTLQTRCSDNTTLLSTCPQAGEVGFGQDAQYQGRQPDYSVNTDGTVTDNHTGLIWTSSADTNGDGKIDADDKLSYDDAVLWVSTLRHGGHKDWRLPDIKELYSLILFDGQHPGGIEGNREVTIRPFLQHEIFQFAPGDIGAGERLIDAQYLSSTRYVATTMKGNDTVFGVNFMDGRIKGYGVQRAGGRDKTFYVLAVRGNTDYGFNFYTQATSGTITDSATGLTWQQNDSQQGMSWSEALSYCENLKLGGIDKWRLPNAKELHSIVDYTRSPATSNSAAIDPAFHVTSIVNEASQPDYPAYWTSTTHYNVKNSRQAVYIAFGRAMGYMKNSWLDVHGAGAQRSDPKQLSGQHYPQGHGPQGDAVRNNNYARCVTDKVTHFTATPVIIKRRTQLHDFSATALQQSDQKAKPAQPADKTDVHFKRMDINSDGKLSKDEVRGPLKHDFKRLDTNGDGFLTREELPKNRPPKHHH